MRKLETKRHTKVQFSNCFSEMPKNFMIRRRVRRDRLNAASRKKENSETEEKEPGKLAVDTYGSSTCHVEDTQLIAIEDNVHFNPTVLEPQKHFGFTRGIANFSNHDLLGVITEPPLSINEIDKIPKMDSHGFYMNSADIVFCQPSIVKQESNVSRNLCRYPGSHERSFNHLPDQRQAFLHTKFDRKRRLLLGRKSEVEQYVETTSMATYEVCGIPDNISPKSAPSVKEGSPNFPTSANIPNNKSPKEGYAKDQVQDGRIFRFDDHEFNSALQNDTLIREHQSLSNTPSTRWQEAYTTYPGIKIGSIVPFGRYPGSTLFEKQQQHTTSAYTPATTTSKTFKRSSLDFADISAGMLSLQHSAYSDLSNPSIFKASDKHNLLNSDIQKSPMLESKAPGQLKKLEFINGGFGIKNPILVSTFSDEEPSLNKQPNRFACSLCDKTFPKQRLLVYHVKNHGNISRFLCAFCGKGFDDKFDLKRHTRTHTGIRPFKCDDCGKAFTQRCSLESHCKKVHASRFDFGYKERREKLHVCEDCGHTTEDPAQHFHHLKLHHPASPLLEKSYDRRHFKTVK